MAALLTRAAFRFLPTEAHELVPFGSVLTLSPYEETLFRSLWRWAMVMLCIFVWCTANNFVMGALHLRNEWLWFELLITFGMLVQTLRVLGVARRRADCTLKEVREVNTLLRVMLLIKVAKLFSDLSGLKLDCTIQRGVFLEPYGLLGTDTLCSETFAFQYTAAVLAYTVASVLQHEHLLRLETSWIRRLRDDGDEALRTRLSSSCSTTGVV